jgi:hypothetical protein
MDGRERSSLWPFFSPFLLIAGAFVLSPFAPVFPLEVVNAAVVGLLLTALYTPVK